MDFTREEFELTLRSALEANRKSASVIHPQKMNLLSEIYNSFLHIAENPKLVSLKLHPAFHAGSVVAEVSELNLNCEKMVLFRNALSKSDSFEVIPLLSGGVRFSMTVQEVFE